MRMGMSPRILPSFWGTQMLGDEDNTDFSIQRFLYISYSGENTFGASESI